MSQEPPPTNLWELFPELSHDIDRRILHAETRVKYWVVGGILVNLFAILVPLVTLVYQLGGIQTQSRAALESIQRQGQILQRRGEWMQDRELWEQSMELWAQQKGYIPPRSRRPTGGQE